MASLYTLPRQLRLRKEVVSLSLSLEEEQRGARCRFEAVNHSWDRNNCVWALSWRACRLNCLLSSSSPIDPGRSIISGRSGCGERAGKGGARVDGAADVGLHQRQREGRRNQCIDLSDAYAPPGVAADAGVAVVAGGAGADAEEQLGAVDAAAERGRGGLVRDDASPTVAPSLGIDDGTSFANVTLILRVEDNDNVDCGEVEGQGQGVDRRKLHISSTG